MKKIFYILVGLIFFSSCSDLLDTNNLYETSLTTYYQSEKDFNEAIAGCYSAMYVGSKAENEELLMANIMDDICFGGGGPNDVSAHYIDNFTNPIENRFDNLWTTTYAGVYRCNLIIEKIQEAGLDEAFSKRILGEAYFMRGYLYWRAAKFFGGLPLVIVSDGPRDVPRSTIEETFAQVFSDFKAAIETLPSTPLSSKSIDDYGHADKWTAQGFMARAFLFYTGYMTNIQGVPTTEAPLAGEGAGTITKQDVIGWLNECISGSGYSLVGDYRNLWPYSAVNDQAEKNGKDARIPWAATNDLHWVGQQDNTTGTSNTEVMFLQRFAFGNWGWSNGQMYSNRIVLFCGPRNQPSNNPWGVGWGFCTVNSNLWNDWPANDPRREGSILEGGNADQGFGYYDPSCGGGDAMHVTDLWIKKYAPLAIDGSTSLWGYLYDNTGATDMQLWAAQDVFLLRYADILLMHSELTETPDGMNAVRGRAGLDPVEWSLENLKKERLYEFAFEGLRWFDIVRWGDVAQSGKTYFGKPLTVKNGDVPTPYTVTYRAETKALIPVPESEIRLSIGSGDYEQNPGW